VKVTPYSISTEQRTTLEEKVMAELNREDVLKPLRSKLEDVCQAAIDQTTDYLSGEYQLVFEELVQHRATDLVKELLKGNHEVAQFFALEARETVWGPDAGEPFVYDPDHVRAAIFERFRDEITHAELIALKEENERLRKDLEWWRERRS
jgi:hypothetical protein